MSQDRELTGRRLNELWEKDLQVLDIEGGRYVIISDTHMGDGGGADDFRRNEKTLEAALEFYNKNNFTLILLGDIEEFWQFDLDQIKKRYLDTVYKKIKAFDGRLIRIFGNHDLEWGCPSDPALTSPQKHECAPEAIKMRLNLNSEPCILLVHGHQGDVDSDKQSWFSRFVVRGLWKPVEPIAHWLGIDRHPSATKSQVSKDYEQVYYSWAKERKVIIICGHSHRAIFASKSHADKLEDRIANLQLEIYTERANVKKMENRIREIEKLRKDLSEERLKGRDIDPTETSPKHKPCYFNSGCALYSDGITAIEIAENKIKLVKWDKSSLKLSQEYGSGDLKKYIQDMSR